jgi:hypothetical protein
MMEVTAKTYCNIFIQGTNFAHVFVYHKLYANHHTNAL